MKVLLFLSDLMIPLVIFYVVSDSFLMKRNVYEDFVRGAKDGLRTVFHMVPTLVGLMTGVGILRSSGLLDLFCELMGVLLGRLGVSVELIPLIVVKMFSSSAAVGLLLDIYRQLGTDSLVGTAASLLLSSTETIFYTMSVYFMAVKVTKTRWTLAGSLAATAAGVAASVILAGWMQHG